MNYTIQLECYKNFDGSLTDVDMVISFENGQFELREYEEKTLALLEGDEVILSNKTFHEEDISRRDFFYNIGQKLIEDEGGAFFTNLIFKDLGGTWNEK